MLTFKEIISLSKDCLHWKLHSNRTEVSLLMFIKWEDDKLQLVVRHPSILDIIEGANTITSSLASRLNMHMRMFAETYGKDNYYL